MKKINNKRLMCLFWVDKTIVYYSEICIVLKYLFFTLRMYVVGNEQVDLIECTFLSGLFKLWLIFVKKLIACHEQFIVKNSFHNKIAFQ